MFNPSTNQWTWMSGSMNADQTGIYGTKGTAAPANVPGARYRPVTWLGSDAHLWLFGGYGRDGTGHVGELNDLWKFNPATLEWTWVSGSDIRDQAGTYGTKGAAAPANVPGARDASTSWLDATGRFWLFGGEGYGVSALGKGQLNDLWMYDPATNQWTWVSGDNTVDHVGVFGTQGTASASNNPGGIHGATGWIDPTGKLWLFGGTGHDAVGTLGMLNDLWKYDPATNQWTWTAGSKTSNRRGIYGPLGKRYLSNNPGGREHLAGWTNASGELWLLGGDGYDADGPETTSTTCGSTSGRLVSPVLNGWDGRHSGQSGMAAFPPIFHSELTPP